MDSDSDDAMDTQAPAEVAQEADVAADSEEAAAEEAADDASPARAPAARLLITKMVLTNFKSYGGEREIGPFHKCFSSIVGPNGSGKSNVIDAMLFVFGKRAKKLRLNKVSELIHRSDTYPNLDSAKVAVHFVDIIDNTASEDDYTEVPGSELVVTRTAYRNNSSKYTVDGKTATFTEVGALLRKRGIDLDNNRFLILQGEVEQIAMMKPKAEGPHDEGLLEYLEDIIGSNRHVEATEAAAAEVDALSEQRTEKLNRLKAAEKEKESLEGAKTEAEAFLQKERELRAQRNVLYQISISEAEANVGEVNSRHAELTERLTVERGRLTETEANQRAIEENYEGMTGELLLVLVCLHAVLSLECLRCVALRETRMCC
jgi:structural maintenance of chromosome 4